MGFSGSKSQEPSLRDTKQPQYFPSLLLLSLFQEGKCGDFKAVIVEVAGQAHYTGTASLTVEEDDPLRDGFLLK